MGNNKLKLNPDKMEFIVIGDDQIRSSLKSSFPVSFLGNIMEPADSVAYVTTIYTRYLNHETAVKVANALVSSHLDYCSSLLYNTKGIYWQTTKSLKCLMSYCVQTK